MQATLKITIDASAAIRVEVLNAQGSGCVELTDPLKVHGNVIHFEAKPEFYAQETTVVTAVTPDCQC